MSAGNTFRKIERVATGVPGLDSVLNGGLLSGGVYILMGAPGAGKTIMANQICFQAATSGQTPRRQSGPPQTRRSLRSNPFNCAFAAAA